VRAGDRSPLMITKNRPLDVFAAGPVLKDGSDRVVPYRRKLAQIRANRPGSSAIAVAERPAAQQLHRILQRSVGTVACFPRKTALFRVPYRLLFRRLFFMNSLKAFPCEILNLYDRNSVLLSIALGAMIV
jgi:hypothetical protein